MMNNNKILTVSYGTFSCTLEGFDDSFGTMKAIAEYFRDLASDDRYFGAEPPQPDAEMLQRIAQKEMTRRVEAREHEGKIVLSALEEDTRPVPAEPSQTAALAAPAAAVAAAVAEANTDPAPAPAAQEPREEIAVEAETGASDDIIAADARALEETVEETAVEEVAVEDDPVLDETALAEAIEEEAAQEAPAQEPETDVADVLAQLEAADESDDENDIVPGQPDADVEAFFDTGTRDVAEDAVAEPVAPAPAPEADSIAAKLQRIRAVVAQHDDDEEDDDFSEDEHAAEKRADAPATPKAAAAEPDVMTQARQDIEDALDIDADLQGEMAATDDDDIDEITALLNRLETTDAAPAPIADDTQTMVDVPTAAVAEEIDADDAADDALENLFEESAPEITETPVAAPAPTKAANVVASEGLSLEAEPQAPAPKAAPRARVIKVKRADLEAAIQKGDLEEYDDEDETPVGLDDLAPARTAGSSLSAEDEDELARELAELEADMEVEVAPQAPAQQAPVEAAQDVTDDVIAAALAADEAPAPEQPRAARPKLPEIDEGQGEDMSRLMAEADHQMGEPESATRRDAFAHLRAAVAAKKADEALGREDAPAGDDAYRNDLADVVRPRRPVSGEARTKRPGQAQPAPLKLVAEQRIDVEAKPKEPVAPVRPRRVAAEAPVEAESDSFADYAAEMGATKLPELLEAAASYMAFVEGRDQFSRPQLMTKVRQAGPEGFSREDTLRSFGKLLREGKIEKIKAGRFAASEDIGFRPDQRAVG